MSKKLLLQKRKNRVTKIGLLKYIMFKTCVVQIIK